MNVQRPTGYDPIRQRASAHPPQPSRKELEGKRAAEARPVEEERGTVTTGAAEDVAAPEAATRRQPDEWRDRALRLQAEMDNYRKRQRRLAQTEIDRERQRLLSSFLRVVDDLERALAVAVADDDGFRQGVELTHRAALQILQKEGVQPIEAKDLPFDPTWHEAVATVPGGGHRAAPNTVVQVLEPGYRLGDQLLRPAKVIVAT